MEGATAFSGANPWSVIRYLEPIVLPRTCVVAKHGKIWSTDTQHIFLQTIESKSINCEHFW